MEEVAREIKRVLALDVLAVRPSWAALFAKCRGLDPTAANVRRKVSRKKRSPTMADIPQWWMRGDWFDVCSCNIACPCEFAQPPTNNKCEGVLAYHVREGAYGEVRLDQLNVLGVAQFTGNIWAGEAQVSLGLFIDERANDAQRQ